MHPEVGELNPFECREVTIVSSATSWGVYKDNLVIKIGKLDPIKMPIEVEITSSPIFIPSNALRFGTIAKNSSKTTKKTPVTNLSSHPVTIHFQVMNQFDYMIYKDSGSKRR